MGSLFSAPTIKMPSAPPPVPTPSPSAASPTSTTDTANSMAAANREAQISAQGKARNILTSPQGLPPDQELENIDQKRLTGV